MRSLNGRSIDQSAREGCNCIVLHLMGRETNKHSSFTPQIRFALQRSRVSGLKKQALPGKSKAVAPDLATNAHKSFA